MSLAKSFVEVEPDARNFGRLLDRDLRKIDGSKSGRHVGDSFAKGFGGGIKGIAAMAGGAFAGLQAASGLKDIFSDSIAEAREAAKVTRLTEAVIKSTGGAARVSAADIDALAGALSNKIGVDDDAIQSGANLMLTFTNVRNEAGKGNDIFNQSVAVMNDMSAALGTDVKGSAIQLGKALNDPIKGVTALQRVGVSFTKDQKEQIKTLVESGRTMDAQKLILAELNKEFGGAAAAASDPAQKAQVAWANFKEELGSRMLPTLGRLSAWFTSDGLPMLSDWISTTGEVIGWIGQHRTAIGILLGTMATLYTAHKAHLAIQWLQTGALKKHILQMGIVRGATLVWTGAQWLLNAALTANPIGLVIVAIAALAAGIVIAYKRSETFRNIVTGAWKAVQTGASWMWDRVLKPVFRFIITAWLNVAGAIINGAAKAFGWVPGLGGKLRTAARNFNKFKDDVNRSLNRLDNRTIEVNAKFRASYGATAGGLTLTPKNFGRRHGVAKGGLIPKAWAIGAMERMRMALGGAVPETGNSLATADSVKALLMPGEFVVRRDGSNLGDAVDHFRQRFAVGGPVIRRPGSTTINRRSDDAWWSMARHVGGKMRSAYNEYMNSIPGPAVGGGVTRWAPLVLKALQLLGQSASWLPTVLRRMNQESGGNPRAINLWDINAKNGTPSIGLMQTIGPTFNAYAGRFRSRGIYDPFANIYAGLNYAVNRYGTLGALNRPGGYDLGGMLQPKALGMNYGSKPERVLSPRQTEAFERLVAILDGRESATADRDGRGPMRWHPDDIRALGAELRAGMASANVETARTASVYERTAY